MDDNLAATIWEEARRLLVRQEADLDLVRGRAITLLSASAVASGLFATRLPDDLSEVARLGLIVAVISFAFSVGLALKILWPTTFTFSHELTEWIEDLRHARSPKFDEWAYNVGRDLESYRKANIPKVTRMYDLVSAICVLLGVQVVAWLVAIA